MELFLWEIWDGKKPTGFSGSKGSTSDTSLQAIFSGTGRGVLSLGYKPPEELKQSHTVLPPAAGSSCSCPARPQLWWALGLLLHDRAAAQAPLWGDHAQNMAPFPPWLGAITSKSSPYLQLRQNLAKTKTQDGWKATFSLEFVTKQGGRAKRL